MNAISPIVSAPWLASHLHRADVIVIDCRFQLTAPDWGYQQYLDSHIAGADYLDLDRDLSGAIECHGGRHPLPNPDILAQKLDSIGVISGQTHVIAYDDSRFAFASRLWWLLRYLGHDRVSLLDGGWRAWREGGYPISAVVPEGKRGRFIADPHDRWVVSIEQVKARPDSVVLLDSREGDRYRGEREPIDPIAGHIEGAVNYPWLEVTDDRGFIHPRGFHQQRWQACQNAGETIVYCGSGVTACVNILSLTLAGYDSVKLYSGGWSDWCSYPI
jgi:thiosulfate/3-mercaptopyruvate sulfurtransferase